MKTERETQERLWALLRADHRLTSELGLREVLVRVVECAVELGRARYGALGVLEEGGEELSLFVQVGLDERQAEQIGEVPRGRGLLGALISEPRTLRLERIEGHALATGFPPGHPPMSSFLGVPIRVGDAVFGNLYLADHVDGAFDEVDEQLVEALAVTAGIAIANARLLEETRHRARWSAALAEAEREGTGADAEAVDRLLRVAAELAGADLAWVLRRDPGSTGLTVLRAAGAAAQDAVGRVVDAAGSPFEEALATQRPVRSTGSAASPVEGLPWPGPGPSVVVPFDPGPSVAGGTHAVALVRAPQGAAFLPRDLEMLETFAAHVGVALVRAQSRAAHERLALSEDRSRIARDLHDHVIQRLYATGLRLSAVASQVQEPDLVSRIEAQIDQLDTTIVQIRQAIHALTSEDQLAPRARLTRLVDEVAGFDVTPEVRFRGPVDTLLDRDLLADVVAVVREGLSNAVRHGHARKARVEVAASSDRVEVTVSDDGAGLGSPSHTGGLGNLRERARRRGGELRVHNAGTGVELSWWVPPPAVGLEGSVGR